MGLSSAEVLVLVHPFSDKENTKAESSKNKDFCIRFIRGFVYHLRRKKTSNPLFNRPTPPFDAFCSDTTAVARLPSTVNGRPFPYPRFA